MDRKLCMPEILDIVFAYLGPVDDFFPQTRRTLAALARTCTTFRDSALNALWAPQTSLVPALRCFPDDLWDRSADPAKLSFLEIQRPLVPADWDRPLLYWKRIKSFYMSFFDPNCISPAVIEMLRICCPTREFFPGLREFWWHDETSAQLSLLAIFLSPRLKSIHLYPGESMMELSLLRTLGIKCPDLTEVDLRGTYRRFAPAPLFLQSLLELLSSLKRLETLCICSIDAAIFNHIARLPCLKSLVVDEPWPVDFISDGGSAPNFPELEQLSLWSTTPDVSCTIVETISHRGLRQIDLMFETVFPDAQTTARLYAAIGANVSQLTLKSLHIEDDAIHGGAQMPLEEEFKSYIIGGDTLTVLFSFTNLTTIVLKPLNGFDVDDTVIEKMARSWSRVEELRVAFSMDWHVNEFPTTRTTLRGVHAIATHCSNLHTLELFFDALAIPAIDNMTTQTNLVEFDVLCSPITSSKAVARFLADVFPQLRTLNSFCVDESDVHVRGQRHWEKVGRFLEKRFDNTDSA
ncbi:hypothetical protein MSAN_01227200 [Mycena sanguinolenta]|uniref:F-box domain-containing protein n=1 Tax=Mycena sanguinolenta TaxID=230812 RepID=A0A8H7D4R5_9AGAR|nr:hypothetical protein MSAN_01227200 [Mycena sanguinolenta]